MTLATSKGIRVNALRVMRPPLKLTLSQWADENFRLSAENAAVPGRWTTLPYQTEMMDAMCDPNIAQVSVMKSARIGYTTCLTAACAFHIAHDPCGILLLRPDLDACREFTKEVLSPMVRDVPSVAAVLSDDNKQKHDDTLTNRRFPGGVLTLAGAHSGAGLRSISRRVVIFDETDAYPPSAGSDGDQIALGMKRSETFWNRKTIAGSTPLVTGASRIETLFMSGDRRRFHLPCPHCGHFDFLTFSPRSDARGHVMVFVAPEKGSEPIAKDVHFECGRCHGRIEHDYKREWVAQGKWVAEAPFHGHASFHIWSAYSFSPGAAWQAIADEFLAKKEDRTKLKTFVNTTLGETMPEAGDAPDWEPLYARRETYEAGSLPTGVKAITLGVDVHKDRLVYEVVGWGAQKESWSLDFGVLLGDIAGAEAWKQLDELRKKTYGGMRIRMTAVDSSAFTQTVYTWVRAQSQSQVMACKGVWGARALVGVPTAQDVSVGGKTIQGGVRLWPIGVDGAKAELYGWLHLPEPKTCEPHPLGWCHFPEWPEEYFRQITSEKLSIVEKKGTKVLQWKVLEGRENHLLDARVYARAAAARAGIDRLKGATTVAAPGERVKDTAAKERQVLVESTAALIWEAEKPAPAQPAAPPAPAQPAAPPAPPQRPRKRGTWLRGGSSGGWL